MKRASKRKRPNKTIAALGAAGLTLASEASLAATAPALDTMTRKAGVSHEIILREEEIFDVTLSSFYIFDKERGGAFQAGGSAHQGYRMLRVRVFGGASRVRKQCLFAPGALFGPDAASD